MPGSHRFNVGSRCQGFEQEHDRPQLHVRPQTLRGHAVQARHFWPREAFPGAIALALMSGSCDFMFV